MKGLIRTSIIAAAIIIIGIGTGIIITVDLGNKLAVAHESGHEEGYVQGYVEGSLEGSRLGYQTGSKTGYIMGGGADEGSDETGFYFTYNPTYSELQEFLSETGTSSAKEIHDYAEASGIRVAYVRCQIAREAAKGRVYVYELVAFETVDNGLVIIEPWSLEDVKIEVGKYYSVLNGRPPRAHDDTITKVTIVW